MGFLGYFIFSLLTFLSVQWIKEVLYMENRFYCSWWLCQPQWIMHSENLLHMLICKAHLQGFQYIIHTVYDWNTNYLQYPATNIMFLQLWWYRVHSSKWFTVQTISSLTNLDHNPSHVHSMYIIPQNHTPDNNVLMANILYSSLFYHSTGILTKTTLFLSVEWSTHKYICVLTLTTWRWPHEWPKNVGGHYIIKLH